MSLSDKIKSSARTALSAVIDDITPIADEFYADYELVVKDGVKARYNLNRLRKYCIKPPTQFLDIPLPSSEFLNDDVSPKPLTGKNILIEFSSPNIAKRFHMGHIRSTLLGSFLTRLFKTLGASTHSVCYLGDYGKQFGLLIYGYYHYEYQNRNLSTIGINDLVEIYVSINAKYEKEKKKDSDKFRQMNTDIEKYTNNLDPRNPIYKYFKSISLDEYKREYSRLGIEFDEYDSEMNANYYHNVVIGILRSRELLKIDEYGRGFVDLRDYDLGKLVVQKSSGGSLYSSRDLGTFINRVGKYAPDEMYYVVASEQSYYFKQLFKTLELMGFENWVARTHHIDFGMVLGMSTRKGSVVYLNDVINKTTSLIETRVGENKEKFNIVGAQIKNVCNELAISAIRIQDLGAKRQRDYEFRYDIITNFTGFSGPYLQYTHARLYGVKEKNPNIEPYLHPECVDDTALSLLLHTRKFNQILIECFQSLDASVLLRWVFELAKLVNGCYTRYRVQGESNTTIASTRLAVFERVRARLAQALQLIGCHAIQQM